jgi:hypothetical protein
MTKEEDGEPIRKSLKPHERHPRERGRSPRDFPETLQHQRTEFALEWNGRPPRLSKNQTVFGRTLACLFNSWTVISGPAHTTSRLNTYRY